MGYLVLLNVEGEQQRQLTLPAVPAVGDLIMVCSGEHDPAATDVSAYKVTHRAWVCHLERPGLHELVLAGVPVDADQGLAL